MATSDDLGDVDVDERSIADIELSEDLVSSPQHKEAGITQLDFDGLLDSPLRLYEDLKEGCGGQRWPAGMVLTKYLLRDCQLDALHGKRILELGAGGGLVSIAIAIAQSKRAFHTSKESSSLLDNSQNNRASIKRETGEGLNTEENDWCAPIHVTDQEIMLSLMQKNIILNVLSNKIITAGILNWGDPIPENISQPDIILAAECVYFEPAFPLLLKTMQDLIVGDTICYLCFKKRRRADLRFVKEARKIFKVAEVQDDPEKDRWSKEGLFMYKITIKS